MHADEPEEPVLEREQVEQDDLATPGDGADDCARHGVEDKVVRRRHDCDQDHERVRQPQSYEERAPLP